MAKNGLQGDYLGDPGLGTAQCLREAGLGATLFLKRIFWDVWTFEGAFQLRFMMIKDNQVMFEQDKKSKQEKETTFSTLTITRSPVSRHAGSSLKTLYSENEDSAGGGSS